MKTFDKYRRIIKLLFAFLLTAALSGIYGFIFTVWLNKIIWAPFWRKGIWMMVFIYTVLLAFFLNIYGGYRIGILKRGNLIFSQILALFFTNFITYLQITVQDKKFTTPVPLVVNLVISAIVVIGLSFLFSWTYCRIFPPRKLLLVSGERKDFHLMEKMNSREDKYEITGTMDYRELIPVLAQEAVKYDALIVGDIPSHERNLIIKYCFQEGVRTYSIPKISDILLRSSEEFNLFDSPLLLSRNVGLQIEQEWMKRVMDIVISLLGLAVTSPLFVLFSACIKMTDGGPVFYTQERLTKDGAVFRILKFRTMVQDAEKYSGAQLAKKDDPRILPVGRILRATRLDELPQLINILRGEMSLVGPRPERPEIAAQIEEKIPEFAYRLKVKAGLTGLAQVYGKYNTTFYDKLKLDLTYIRNYSIFLDLKLIIMTPKIMFMKEASEGVAAETLEEKVAKEVPSSHEIKRTGKNNTEQGLS